jgi:hypothetical protein
MRRLRCRRRASRPTRPIQTGRAAARHRTDARHFRGAPSGGSSRVSRFGCGVAAATRRRHRLSRRPRQRAMQRKSPSRPSRQPAHRTPGEQLPKPARSPQKCNSTTPERRRSLHGIGRSEFAVTTAGGSTTQGAAAATGLRFGSPSLDPPGCERRRPARSVPGSGRRRRASRRRPRPSSSGRAAPRGSGPSGCRSRARLRGARRVGGRRGRGRGRP